MCAPFASCRRTPTCMSYTRSAVQAGSIDSCRFSGMSWPKARFMAGNSLRGSRERSPEHGGKLRDEPAVDLGLVELSARLALERRHPPPGDATRDDEVETGEIGADVERQAVAGDPTRDADPDRTDLVVAD